jgi:leader peptidase (prepilin peptidase)/N-methyltransferase
VDVALGLVAFWPALALGSFMNVVAARVPQRRSVVRPRSACMSCGSELAWYDNVPVVSWLLLRGRCRSCGAGSARSTRRLSWRPRGSWRAASSPSG